MNVNDFVEKVKKKEIDVVKHTKEVIEKVKKINKEFNHFNVISEELALEQAKAIADGKVKKGKLLGVPVSIKDCICVKGVESRAGSKILSGYKPTFNATAVQRVIDEGAIIIGKTSQDAFGFGSFSINVGLGMKIPLNPFDKERTCGGSSGGSGGITQKADFVHVSLGESTGGSIECPSSFCGVVGFCPTYGRVSRYGLMDYANSLDKIGPMAKSVEDAALMLEIITGYDKKDTTSVDKESEEFTSFLNRSIKGMKIGLVKESIGEGITDEVKKEVMALAEKLEAHGAIVKEVSLPITFKYGIPAYYLISTSEASTNLAKYCGMRYGAEEVLTGGFNEYFTKVRSNNFNAESKRRIMLGTFARMAGYRDAYYIKATKVRTKIIDEYKKSFSKFDCLISPTMPFVAPRLKDIERLTPLQNYLADILTVGPNLAGIPHASVPIGTIDGMPVGIMIMADHFNESKVIQLGSAIEEINKK
ncbi:MAG: amidase family protein [Candidatus Woesearchaeota archaeon]